MKIILSRKGFDSVNGGCPSPILPDGTLLSMPIPLEETASETLTYSDIHYNEYSYEDIWKRLQPKRTIFPQKCHLDPDIRADIRKHTIEGWRPAFGQIGAAETELENNGVTIGDIFLFFGWFRQTVVKDDKLVYQKNAPDVHIIFGYMQIGEIKKDKEIDLYYWHPHTSEEYKIPKNNTLYLPGKQLAFNCEETTLSGYGTFSFSERLILTHRDMGRSRWKLLDWMPAAKISHHSATSLHGTYFQSACIGQEFVIQDNEYATEWAKSLF